MSRLVISLGRRKKGCPLSPFERGPDGSSVCSKQFTIQTSRLSRLSDALCPYQLQDDATPKQKHTQVAGRNRRKELPANPTIFSGRFLHRANAFHLRTCKTRSKSRAWHLNDWLRRLAFRVFRFWGTNCFPNSFHKSPLSTWICFLSLGARFGGWRRGKHFYLCLGIGEPGKWFIELKPSRKGHQASEKSIPFCGKGT